MSVNKRIIPWLQTVLLERYGSQLEIEIEIVENFWVISSANRKKTLRIALSSILYQLGKADFSCSQWSADKEGWHSALGKPLIVLGDKPKQDMIVLDDKGATVQFDILGLVYWCLSRSEEVGREDLDNHERFPAKHSHAHQHGYLERPIVDEWLHLLGQVIEKVWPDIKLKENSFSVKVSHDVDIPSLFGFVDLRRFIRRYASSLLLDKNIGNLLTAPWVKLRTKDKLLSVDAYNSFDWLMGLSEKYGLTSAFYFICGRTDDHKDADYDLEYPAIRQLMRNIHQRGHEIGLHPSYNTFKNASAIQSEANHLKKICVEENIDLPVIGGRMHYLRWQHPYTMQAWNDAGLAYDSTMSYADHAGFRCGTCFEYPAINPITKEMLRLRIRPLIAMECSIISDTYMGLGWKEEGLNKFVELADKCKRIGGCFTLLWHNSQLITPRQKKMYENILDSVCNID